MQAGNRKRVEREDKKNSEEAEKMGQLNTFKKVKGELLVERKNRRDGKVKNKGKGCIENKN